MNTNNKCFVKEFNTYFFVGLTHVIENHLLQNSICTLLLNVLKAMWEVEEYIEEKCSCPVYKVLF